MSLLKSENNIPSYQSYIFYITSTGMSIWAGPAFFPLKAIALHEHMVRLYCEYHFQGMFGAGFWHNRLKAPHHTTSGLM